MTSVSDYQYEKRRTTDKKWCRCFVVFSLAFAISWTVYWQFVIHHQPDPNGHNNTSITEENTTLPIIDEINKIHSSDDGFGSDNSTEFVHHEISNQIRNDASKAGLFRDEINKNFSSDNAIGLDNPAEFFNLEIYNEIYNQIKNDTSKAKLFLDEIYKIISSDYGLGSDKSTEFFQHEISNPIKNDTLKTESFLEMLKEMFDFAFNSLTCNPTFFAKTLKQINEMSNKNSNEKPDEREPLRIMSFMYYILSTIAFFAIGLLFIRYDKKIVSKQPSIVAAVFLYVVLIEHLSIMCHLSHSVEYSSPLFHKKLIYWMVPESAVLAILISKMFSRAHNKDTEETNAISLLHDVSNDDSIDGDADDKTSVIAVTDDSHNNESATDDGVGDDAGSNFDKTSDDEDDRKDNSVYRIIPFHYYIYAIIFGFPFVIILKLLMMSTLSVLDKVGWYSPYFYIIAGLSFLVGRTIFYYGLMLTTAATDILIDSENFTLGDVKQAIFIITRYHFGTACYHATPIGPDVRVHELREEFKDDKKYDRTREKYKRYYKLTRSITASQGYDYYDSISQLLSLVTKIRMEDYFSSLGDMFAFAFFLLLPSNNLMHILLWYYEYYDAAFANASWVMYLSIACMFYCAMEFFKAVSDTIGLRLCEKHMSKIKAIQEV